MAAAFAIGFFLLAPAISKAAAQSYKPAPADSIARPPDLLGMVRVNHRATHVVVEISPRQSHVTEITVRSGGLGMTLVNIEITFADGGSQRIAIDDTLPPGHLSRVIPVDSQRALRKVVVHKRPSLMPGETVIQLLGRVVAVPGTRPSLR